MKTKTTDAVMRRSAFVLQDHKRLPARFFSRISGALASLRG
ncbi:hypothetical protein [Peteryoungia desertarenae]|nr:hypothetical protein [Peteryoungia desertarenae]